MADGPTILIVDDQEANRQVLHDLVLTLGHQPVTAENGLSALARIRRQPPDVVLLDIMMPVMDGYEFIREIRKMDRYEDMPVIALTAKSMPEDRAECLACGASDYLTKPVDSGKLVSLLRVWLLDESTQRLSDPVL